MYNFAGTRYYMAPENLILNNQKRISYNPNLNSRKISTSSPKTERKESRNTMQPEIKDNLTIGPNNHEP